MWWCVGGERGCGLGGCGGDARAGGAGWVGGGGSPSVDGPNGQRAKLRRWGMPPKTPKLIKTRCDGPWCSFVRHGHCPRSRIPGTRLDWLPEKRQGGSLTVITPRGCVLSPDSPLGALWLWRRHPLAHAGYDTPTQWHTLTQPAESGSSRDRENFRAAKTCSPRNPPTEPGTHPSTTTTSGTN